MPAKGRRIKDQDDRNRRLQKVRPGKARHLARKGVSLMHCKTCRKDLKISWRTLAKEIPLCRKCGTPLSVVTALLNQGVLPKL
jgi:hypothetical protein